MQVPRCVPLDLRQSMANIQMPSSPVLRDMQGKCLIFLASGTGPGKKEKMRLEYENLKMFLGN